ncbi:nucleoside recognition family protein [Magnetospirillum sp. ME-1]|uniref:nucleoside recognition domain-containing protein n=1 Tax=Magnetospirillum sp. ME-1 TaxID=1639348 RepID=UPI000A17F22A|nr:nucleoside recognition domain-containing protein [Magnetospirillum sp. ME-1]ARJ66736.1 nucleoside recognition family protein [Magnetospirillum sp. ME-1]
MNTLITIVLPAGRSAIELSLFVLLPIMVVMLSMMRLLEAWGVLDWLVGKLTPILRPFGLTGLATFAAIQVSFVSFAAPAATLAMMEQRGTSDRHLAAAFAMVLAMAQANAAFPLGALGLSVVPVLGVSLLGGLLAATIAYHVAGRGLSAEEQVLDETLKHPVAENAKGVVDVINRAGAEAFRIAISAIPMLVVSLTVVTALRQAGAIQALTNALPFIDPDLILPAVTKYLAGGTAMLGIVDELARTGHLSAAQLNAWAGILIHPLDFPGVAVLMAAGPRTARVWKPAVLGSLAGIALRGALHLALN